MDRRTGFEVDVLVQQAQSHATRAHDVAAIRRLVTTNETEDRAFTGAVSTYKSDVFSGIDLQRRAAQDVLRPIRLMYI